MHQPPQQAVPAALGQRQPHVVAQLLRRHFQVAGVPEHPPDEAEENADAARVDEQVGEEHVGEHAGQQHREAQRVEGQRQPEGGHAAAQPAGGRHGGGSSGASAASGRPHLRGRRGAAGRAAPPHLRRTSGPRPAACTCARGHAPLAEGLSPRPNGR